jgi:hypothetical protein
MQRIIQNGYCRIKYFVQRAFEYFSKIENYCKKWSITGVLSLGACLFIASANAQTTLHKDARKYFTSAVQVINNPTSTSTQMHSAIENLQKAAAIDGAFAGIDYYLGLAHYYQQEYMVANTHFLNYASKTKEVNPDYLLYEGIVKYKLTENETAQNYLQEFLNSLAADKDRYKDSLARRNLQLSKQSQTLMSKILPSKKQAIFDVNTETNDEYYPVLTSDRKKMLFNRMETDSLTGLPVNRIYWYVFEGDTLGPNPRPLPFNNIEKKEFILTSMNSTGKKILLVAKDNNGNYDVYESEWMVREFAAPIKMFSQINSYADEKFATYGHNDSLIYVISNRPGGYGGYDIWKINNTPRILYESMINLGPVINTEYNENYIATVNNSPTLFFSSEGHLNIGESDIFRTRLEYGQYTRPVNLGYPINTTGNENTFFPYPTANMGLSTIKNASLDIVITYLPPKAKKPAYIMQEQYLEDHPLGKTTIITPKDE